MQLSPDNLMVDFSSFNVVTDYAKVAAENHSGWSKATQGGGYTNASFGSQMMGMYNAGMKPGAYHFPDPNVTVTNNVRHFLDVARGWIVAGCLAPLLDVENDPPDGVVWNMHNANTFVPGFIAELRRQAGIPDLPVVVYGSDSWWGGILRPDLWGDLSHVFLMVANYNGDPGNTSFKHARLAVHQYTDKAPTPGVKRPTDRSVILPAFTLKSLLIGATQDHTEEDEDMAVKPVYFQAEGYPHGAWRDEFGNYIGFASDAERDNMINAWGDDARLGKDKGGVWMEKLTLDEMVRLSRSAVPATPAASTAGEVKG